jgi:uncharacterized protein YjbI with pentapeptide repeats
MRIEIKNARGEVVVEGEFESIRSALEVAVEQGVNLGRTQLSGAHLVGADLRGANLRGARLRDASLNGVNLSHANLRAADLRDANFSDADLSGAKLRRARLDGAIISERQLRSANLVAIKRDVRRVLAEHGSRTVPVLASLKGGLVVGGLADPSCVAGVWCSAIRSGASPIAKVTCEWIEAWMTERVRGE